MNGWSKTEMTLNGCYDKLELIAIPFKGRMKGCTYFLAFAKLFSVCCPPLKGTAID
jgi:hypothetical protein